MARPPLPIRQWGEIRTTRLTAEVETPVKWVARARFRDDGDVTRQLERYRTSETNAKKALRAHLQERAGTQTSLDSDAQFADPPRGSCSRFNATPSAPPNGRHKSRPDNHVLQAVLSGVLQVGADECCDVHGVITRS